MSFLTTKPNSDLIFFFFFPIVNLTETVKFPEVRPSSESVPSHGPENKTNLHGTGEIPSVNEMSQLTKFTIIVCFLRSVFVLITNFFIDPWDIGSVQLYFNWEYTPLSEK